MRQMTVIATLVLLAACGNGRPAAERSPETPGSLPAALSLDPYEPEIDPERFSAEVDNPYLPWTVGSTWRYEGRSSGEVETIEVVVTDDTKEVMGIDCVVVRDTVRVDGEIVELTDDWYAQDDDGNVWYMGEDSWEYEDGERVSDEGSWEAGVDGAQPGVVMPAHPAPGQSYRQEYLEGEAEDTGEVIEVGASIEVPYGSFDDVVVTEDLNPFEPEIVEHKYYARGIGLVAEKKVEGSDEVVELVAYEKEGSTS